MNEKWFVAAKKADFKQIGEKFHIDQVTARIIRNRDVVGDAAIAEYLTGGREQLHPASLLNGCLEAAKLLQGKIREGKKIRIIGDYDIDGVTATYILYRGLTRVGAAVDYEIPDRMRDGYGLNIRLVQYACEEGVDTIVTCDNGISAVEQIAYAKEQLGMTVVVTDHHEPLFSYVQSSSCGDGEEEKNEGEKSAPKKVWNLPKADVLIDPKLPDDGYPFKQLCGAAVAWKLIQMVYEVFQVPVREADEFLQYVGFATIGDVMDLVGENRILAKLGLRALEQSPDLGMRSLIRVTGLEERHLNAYHVGFVLGPCINAGGRLDTAKRSLRLLLSQDENEAAQLAQELVSLNEERKDLTESGVEEATKLIDTTDLGKDRVLVVYLPECHESIAGIVAGRIRERYYRPTFILTKSGDEVKGSGRSIDAYSMFDELVKCQELFIRFGGHPMAAGISLKEENVPLFREKINRLCTLTDDDLCEKVIIDVPMPLDYIRENLVEEFHVLEPFGKGNEKPLFAEKNLQLLRASVLGKNKNVLKFQVKSSGGRIMEALYFGDVDALKKYLQEKYGVKEVEKLFLGRENETRLSVTYYPEINEFRGLRTLQIVIQNYL